MKLSITRPLQNVPHDKLEHAIFGAAVYGLIRLIFVLAGGHLLPGLAIVGLSAVIAVAVCWMVEEYQEYKGVSQMDIQDIYAGAAGVLLAVFCSWP